MKKSIIVKENSDIIHYLVNYSSYSKNKVKSLIKYKKISVNGSLIKKLPFMVAKNDQISIDLSVNVNLPFEIIYEDKEIIVVNKKAGLLTIGTTKEKCETLYHMVREYVNSKKEQLFIVHRLDLETSGVLLFAKTDRIKMLFQDNWDEVVINRLYIAITEGKMKKQGRIENLLYEEKNTFVHSSNIGKKAITNYKTLKIKKDYSLVDISIETGRKNQIRVHFSELNHPIMGDKKYNAKTNLISRMALHCYRLTVKHPISGKIMDFKTDIPRDFIKFMEELK